MENETQVTQPNAQPAYPTLPLSPRQFLVLMLLSLISATLLSILSTQAAHQSPSRDLEDARKSSRSLGEGSWPSVTLLPAYLSLSDVTETEKAVMAELCSLPFLAQLERDAGEPTGEQVCCLLFGGIPSCSLSIHISMSIHILIKI